MVDHACGEAEEQDRSQARTRKITPRWGDEITGQSEDGVKRGMSMRLLTGKRPEPGQDPGIEQQLGAGIDLLGARRGSPGLLDQFFRRRLPCRREPGGISQRTEPEPKPRFPTQGVSFVPHDCQAGFRRQHQ